MADDRMAIVCKKCNLGVAIAKRYHGEDWYKYPLNIVGVAKFFAKHKGCGEQGYGQHQYRLGYETEDNWEYDTVGQDAVIRAREVLDEMEAMVISSEPLPEVKPLEPTYKGAPRELPLRTIYKGQRPPGGTYVASVYDLAVEWGKVKEAFYEAFSWPKWALHALLRMINSVQRIKDRLWRRK